VVRGQYHSASSAATARSKRKKHGQNRSAGVDPAAFFPGEVARYVAFVKAARPIAPDGEVLVPGEPEARSRAARLADGIPLPDDTWGAIVAAARSVGINRGLDDLLK
jgi:LDH2 family malate/lactate/ureidoglycolate dehydrogenase